MRSIAGNNCHQACPDNLGRSVDCHLELTFDHLIDLFLEVGVLMNGSTTHEVVVSTNGIVPPAPS
jgi:hypothetical protein